MKKPSYIVSVLAILSTVFFLAGCDLFEKDSKPKTELEKLPPATQEGKNTFGCLVDGKAWVTRSSIDADAFYQEGVLFISALLINKDFNQGISMTLFEENLSIGEYILSDPLSYGRADDFRKNCKYFTSINYIGKLTITHFDQTKFIISGIFEFEAYSDDCNETISLAHGRFDLNYAP